MSIDREARYQERSPAVDDPDVDAVLSALPASCRRRLQVMGWPDGDGLGLDPQRVLRRAIGAPQQVSLMDLELDPQRWHGQYVETWGTVGWTRDTTCLGRIWLEPALLVSPAQCAKKLSARLSLDSFPPVFQAHLTGILLADEKVRAAHRARHHSQGGYGRFGLFIAELRLSSVRAEPGTGKRSPSLGNSSPIFT